jgi:1-acyl-sn-glycerol-3-phosphate acyltransferase
MSEANEKASAQEKPKKKWSFFYAAARVLAAIVFHTLAPVFYHGRENLPTELPYMIIANHRSFMDPIIMAYSIKKHDVTFLGKKELVKNKIAGFILRNMHIIPVDRHGTDMAAMRNCISALRNKEILGIFPEGTRHHQGLMDEIEGGTAMIALRSGAPLIPMYITPKFHMFHRTDCYIGEPIPTQDLREKGINKDTCAELLTRITATYAEMAKKAERH